MENFFIGKGVFLFENELGFSCFSKWRWREFDFVLKVGKINLLFVEHMVL